MPTLFRGLCTLSRRLSLPAGYGFTLAEHIDALDGGTWDALTAGRSVFLDRRYLRVLEGAGPENLHPKYAIVHRERRPVFALAAQSLLVRGENLLPHTLETPRGTRHAIRGAAGHWQERLLVCGNMLSCGDHGLGLAPGEDIATLWPAVYEALYRLRKADPHARSHDFVLLKDLPATAADANAEAGTAAALSKLQFERIETEPAMCLTLEPGWRTYEDYLGALTTKYRGAARKVFKEITEAGLTVTRGPIDPREGDALHALYLQVASQADVRLVQLPAGHFPALSAALGEDCRCTVIRRGESPVAFVVTLRDGDGAAAYFVGFDRTEAERAPLYLRLLHASIEDALSLGARRLAFGRTALEPKARLGARPTSTVVYLQHRVPVMNWLLKALLCGVEPEPAPDRNPFKTLAPAE
ncbi:GNAT family N-acetyltransferase [Myxococcota bacterium]|jgi:hypothetical protein|nr:GNAT family N-acetyltransferase [Myxococcota bacterium]